MPSSEGIFSSAYTEYCRNRVLCTYNFFIIIKSATSRLSDGHKTRPYGRTVCCASPEVISSILVSTYFQRHHIHLLALLCCDYLFLIMVLLQRTVHTPLPCRHQLQCHEYFDCAYDVYEKRRKRVMLFTPILK